MPRIALPLVAIVLVFAALAARTAEEKPSPYGKPVVTWEGSYSRIEKSGLRRITDAVAWKSFWLEQCGDAIEHDSYAEPVVPAVDFDRFMVIAIHGGKSVNTRSEGIDFIDEFADHLRIRFDARTYQTMSAARSYTLQPGETQEQLTQRMLKETAEDAAFDARHNTTPYGIFVVAKSGKRIIMEENVQTMLGDPPIWKQQTEFPALGK